MRDTGLIARIVTALSLAGVVLAGADTFKQYGISFDVALPEGDTTSTEPVFIKLADIVGHPLNANETPRYLSLWETNQLDVPRL
ncbi:hypothetical protein CCYS_12790 [Corynebacterium cystitidis DSM 20524]|uniref:Uncharacterized protein n=2 Tax=Corynebacterium cystitidis TaxID=35757 RepID=A0A1H9T4Q6_9CORY|nr:hypothetical protein CCYS_12790 [Corynebacterium cystitidis DSM 20524]SER91719.1 hypothetical protein SAMN05661109_01300 [Corynebacterium cystitidis DSM 20524]SNV61482.1 Uncharacterised protein [Corynebacterium cystitidis]